MVKRTAYRGYLICPYPSYCEGFWIEKDSVTIQRFVASFEEAQRIIDSLLD